MPMTEGGRAPYAPTTAIRRVIERQRTVGVPKIDSDILIRIGITEALVPRTLASLKILGFYDDEGKITPEFDAIKSAHSEDYPRQLGQLIMTAYSPVLQVLGHPAKASSEDIENAFRGFQPHGQLPRMVQLFTGLMILTGFMDADSAPKPGPKRLVRGTRSNVVRTLKEQSEPTPVLARELQQAASAPGVERTKIDLGAAGTVSVEVSLAWLVATDEQVTGVRQAIKDLKALAIRGDATDAQGAVS